MIWPFSFNVTVFPAERMYFGAGAILLNVVYRQKVKRKFSAV
jgi:hypothetical protein